MHFGYCSQFDRPLCLWFYYFRSARSSQFRIQRRHRPSSLETNHRAKNCTALGGVVSKSPRRPRDIAPQIRRTVRYRLVSSLGCSRYLILPQTCQSIRSPFYYGTIYQHRLPHPFWKSPKHLQIRTWNVVWRWCGYRIPFAIFFLHQPSIWPSFSFKRLSSSFLHIYHPSCCE